MFLNTKQVRKMCNRLAGKTARYTDKTSEQNEARRSVVYCFWDNTQADFVYKNVVQKFAREGITNKVVRTGSKADIHRHISGGEYVRIIADIA